MRASIYNAMPLEGVKALIEFMKKFEQENKEGGTYNVKDQKDT